MWHAIMSLLIPLIDSSYHDTVLIVTKLLSKLNLSYSCHLMVVVYVVLWLVKDLSYNPTQIFQWTLCARMSNSHIWYINTTIWRQLHLQLMIQISWEYVDYYSDDISSIARYDYMMAVEHWFHENQI